MLFENLIIYNNFFKEKSVILNILLDFCNCFFYKLIGV